MVFWYSSVFTSPALTKSSPLFNSTPGFFNVLLQAKDGLKPVSRHFHIFKNKSETLTLLFCHILHIHRLFALYVNFFFFLFSARSIVSLSPYV